MKNLATVTLVESRKSESEVDILQSEGSRIEKISELRGASRDGRLCYRGSGKVRETIGLNIGFDFVSLQHGGWQREAEILPEISLRENTLFHTVTR